MDLRFRVLIPTSSGFAVVMAESPNEAAVEQAAVIPGMSRTSLCQRKPQILIATHTVEWDQLCLPNQAWGQTHLGDA